MRKILVALMLVVLAAPAWGGGTSEYDDYRNNKAANDKKYEYDLKVAKRCPDGVEDARDLLQMNPFDNKGKCFGAIPLRAFQIVSKNTGLYVVAGNYEPFALVTFGKKSATKILYGPILKGLGAFQYESASGGLVTVHKFEVVYL